MHVKMRRIILFLVLLIFIIGCAENEQIEKPSFAPQQEPISGKQETIQDENKTQLEKNATEQEKMTIQEGKKAEETPTNWPTFHGNNARTGFSSSKAPSKPNVLWKWTLKDFEEINYEGSFENNWPIINKNKVFFAPGNIFALELKTGEKVWAYTEDDFYPRGLAAGNGKIFASVNNDDNLKAISAGFIYAFDEENGKFLWKYKTEKGISHSLPLFADGKVFVGDDSGNVYAIKGDDGKLIWKKRLGDAKVIHSSPAYEDGMIFIGTEDSIGKSLKPSHLYALNPENGEEVWSFEIDVVSGKLNLIHSAPAISNDVVYFGAENGYFYALSSKDGKLIWKQKIASGSGELIGVSAAAALGYGKVFVGTYEGKFLALEQKDGKIVWEYPIGEGIADSSAVVADGKVYFGAESSYFYSFDANNGNVIWKEKLGKSSAALASGILIVQNALAENNLNEQTPILAAFSDEGKLSLD